MNEIIDINFNGINSDELFNLIKLNQIKIQILNYNGIILNEDEYIVNFYIEPEQNKKIYYINVQNIDTVSLDETNFLINLPTNFYFKYAYFKNNISKSIIIYKKYNYIPFIYLGLPNSKYVESFQINYKYNKIGSPYTTDLVNCTNCCADCSGNYDGENDIRISLFNNYFGTNNYFLNMLELPGDIYSICIPNVSGITSYDLMTNSTNTFEIFKINNKMEITPNTNIYFNDSASNTFPISYMTNLNTYNFTWINTIIYDKINNKIKNTPEDYENVIFNISYIDVSGNIFQSVQSLNLQTFNPDKICLLNESNISYYCNVLFFYNYVMNGYLVDSVDMYSYDYEKYFINTTKPIELYNINTYQNNLYDNIILSDANLTYPIILNITDPYLFINLNYIKLEKNLINPLFSTNNFYKLTLSNKINFNILLDYLINFTIKKYNVYKITNNKYISQQEIIYQKNIYLKNYIYPNLTKYNPNTKFTNINAININNNVVNCIKCKIIFNHSSNTKYKLLGTYSIDTKLFLNNYDLELYHKEYDFENAIDNEEKKKLLSMLLLLSATTFQIKLYFYNKKNSVVPAYYLFNQVILNKNNFNIQFDISPLNNTYTEGYLKLNIKIKTDYYILFLYGNTNTFLSQSKYDELIFAHEGKIFKIFRIDSPNGNQNIGKELYYICFQNLKELNIFMKFIDTGIFVNELSNTNLSNYFNIPKSVPFYNYYDLNNYWVTNDNPTIFNPSQTINRNEIFLSINNLFVNQIYLYGDLFIECV